MKNKTGDNEVIIKININKYFFNTLKKCLTPKKLGHK